MVTCEGQIASELLTAVADHVSEATKRAKTHERPAKSLANRPEPTQLTEEDPVIELE